MNFLDVINLISLLVIGTCCVFAIVHPQIVITRFVEISLWLMAMLTAAAIINLIHGRFNHVTCVIFDCGVAVVSASRLHQLWITRSNR